MKVKVVVVKFSQNYLYYHTQHCIDFYMSMDRMGFKKNMGACVDRLLCLAARGLQS